MRALFLLLAFASSSSVFAQHTRLDKSSEQSTYTLIDEAEPQERDVIVRNQLPDKNSDLEKQLHKHIPGAEMSQDDLGRPFLIRTPSGIEMLIVYGDGVQPAD
jgi:hypothetical protein